MTDQATPAKVRLTDGLGPLVTEMDMGRIQQLLDAVPDIGDQRAREVTIARMAHEAGQAAERERLIRMVEARAQTHNGPHLLTLELNQLAAWMAGKSWHGVTPQGPNAPITGRPK